MTALDVFWVGLGGGHVVVQEQRYQSVHPCHGWHRDHGRVGDVLKRCVWRGANDERPGGGVCVCVLSGGQPGDRVCCGRTGFDRRCQAASAACNRPPAVTRHTRTQALACGLNAQGLAQRGAFTEEHLGDQVVIDRVALQGAHQQFAGQLRQ